MRKAVLGLLLLAFAAYTLAVYGYGGPSEKSGPTPAALAGWEIWQEKNCQSCHQLYGLGGYMGPDLTDVTSEKGAAYMRGFIKYGTGKMPSLGLSDEEVSDVISFLAWVDESGNNKIQDSSVHWTGSYSNVEHD